MIKHVGFLLIQFNRVTSSCDKRQLSYVYSCDIIYIPFGLTNVCMHKHVVHFALMM